MSDTQKHNRRVHTISLTFNRLGDGLVDPKLVLAWLVSSLGAGAGWVGLLVPLREAGALLPQLFTASRLRFVTVRKWWWVFGAAVQAAAVAGMVGVALTLTGAPAGAAIATLVAVFAVARSISSVSYKDVLGKTVDKPNRGAVSGTAASLAASGVLLFGLILMSGVVDRSAVVIGALLVASLSWTLASLTFARLLEEPSVITASKTDSAFRLYLSYLKHDKELQKFLVVRGLLIATAVTPPFLILLAGEASGSIISQLGALVVASSFATFVSGYVWGTLSDYSTSLVLAITGVSTSGMLALAVYAVDTGLYETIWFL
ncbi:MAG TPA: MFS transporter, partial [Candidatus Paceibacterota bacterium]|nr:MFS transporter [Candidatus Paceibacterota bacterium]